MLSRMARWEPNAGERLRQAAWELFHEHGYADVTIADIAARAGLTKRTFFNHFTDKREVLFAGAQAFEANVRAYAAEADGALSPIETAVSALTRAGQDLAQFSATVAVRRDLIASSTELQERSLNKTAALTAALTSALVEREVPERTAALAAQAAVVAFNTAYDDWADEPGADFSTLIQRALSDLREAVRGALDDVPA